MPVAQGVRLHYVVAGEGEPVLLLPGWPQSWYAWRRVIPGLVEAGRRVFAIDPRGFGDSDKPDQGYDLATAAADIRAFVAHVLPDSPAVDLVTHDVGTWIGHALAIEHADVVRRWVAADATIPGVSEPPPAGYPDRLHNARSWHFGFNRIEGLAELMIQGREREFLAWFFGPFKATRTWTIGPADLDEYVRVFSFPGAVRAGLMYYREAFSDAGLAASRARGERPLSMPVLTLGGADGDGNGLYQALSSSCDRIANKVWEGVGHYLPEECPEDVIDAIVGFWNQT